MIQQFFTFLLLTSSFLFLQATPPTNPPPSEAPVSKLGEYTGYSEPIYKGYEYQSFYVKMRDGVDLAVDVYLPKKLPTDAEIPAILHYTRYVRSIELKQPFKLFKHPFNVHEKNVQFFTSYGYAYVIVDARGTGASMGTRKMEFSPDEIEDGGEILDWIVKQAWSNGKVGTEGISYPGTTAELLVANQHPALKAAFIRNAIYDLYEDIVFPGGVQQTPFVDIWHKTTFTLDKNDFSPFGRSGFVKGINPVQGDKRRKKLKEAIKQHEDNFNFAQKAKELTYRDESPKGYKKKLDEYSVCRYIEEISQAPTALYRVTGWYDGALTNAAVKGMMNTPNTQKLLIGPWTHGNQKNISTRTENYGEVMLDMKVEMLRFFDFHLKGIDNHIDEEPLVHYYTLGEEKWKTSEQWPITEAEPSPFYLQPKHQLGNSISPSSVASSRYEVDYTAGTGGGSRWNGVTELYKYEKLGYPNRKERDEKLWCFDSEVLADEVEISGHPIANIYLSADATDATVFVYIEEVASSGEVFYVTEGQFRAIHRKPYEGEFLYAEQGPVHRYLMEDAKPMKAGEIVHLQFDLQPVSYQFQEGSRIRIAIAGADIDHFDLPKDQASYFDLHHSSEHPSHVVMPFVEE